jgi:DNA-binding MarR family transcriptional regulator
MRDVSHPDRIWCLNHSQLEEIISTADLRAALRRFLRTTEICARQTDLTPRQYLLLLLVKGTPDRSECSTIGDLSQRMQLAQSTVTELVSRAVAAGLVTADQSKDDGRVTEVRVSPEGERRLLECFELLGTERRALREALADHILVPS